MLIGPTHSGKSTLMDSLECTLGPEQCGATNLQLLAYTHGLFPLVGKSSAFAGDIRGTIRRADMDSALVTLLRVVGEDTIPINPKNGTLFHTKLNCRFTMGMNDLPMFTDHPQAIISRTLILNVPNSYLGREDFSLKKRIREEANNGLLINFFLRGLKDLREQGTFVEPNSSKTIIDQFRGLVSPIMTFIDECCTLGDGLFLNKDLLYDAWRQWCRDNERKPGNKQMFQRWLAQQMPQLVVVTKGEGGNVVHLYKDIALKPWVAMKYLGGSM